MSLGIQKNSRGAEGKNKKTPDLFSDFDPFSDFILTWNDQEFQNDDH